MKVVQAIFQKMCTVCQIPDCRAGHLQRPTPFVNDRSTSTKSDQTLSMLDFFHGIVIVLISMEVVLRYENQNISLHLPANPSIQQLQKEVNHQVQIQPSRQTLIFKGKILSHKKDKLSAYGISNHSKILLFAKCSDSKEDSASRRHRTAPEMDQPPHSQIIARGPPEGCLEGMKSASRVFPNAPFVVYYSNGTTIEGDRTRLSIESDALWFETDSGKKEREYFNNVELLSFTDLPGYIEQYVAVMMRISRTFRTIYFFPKQYQQLLDDILRPSTFVSRSTDSFLNQHLTRFD
jgi:hypothetical protein